jgi:hypothetical protein
VARVEDVGPVLLNRLAGMLGEHCSIQLKPVIDLPAGHIAVDDYEIPARLREHSTSATRPMCSPTPPL